MAGKGDSHPGVSTLRSDRSPCGTGTNPDDPVAFPRRTPLGHDFANESFAGTQFTGRLIAETIFDRLPVVVPTVTGRTWITGSVQHFLNPSDPFSRSLRALTAVLWPTRALRGVKNCCPAGHKRRQWPL
ncbi:proline racemase family protein (plasmid) [Streptomyces sp. NBC_01724]|uniref:proline racemase family protein n=1 Tax=Streptomyces sp. NBC_01724 TaxID=2975922 RepID=UPI002E314AEA|nr:proline racemase family protein [Streptomyces sp. NBC_01724]